MYSQFITCEHCGTVRDFPPSEAKGRRFCSATCYRASQGTYEERFWANVQKSGGCWLWIGTRNRKGYGWMQWYGRAHLAHRISYTLAHGGYPADHDIHHICETPACVNPAHLMKLSHNDHALEYSPNNPAYQNKRKTHCKRGHEFTPENTYISAAPSRRNPVRVCRTCVNLISRDAKRRARANRAK